MKWEVCQVTGTQHNVSYSNLTDFIYDMYGSVESDGTKYIVLHFEMQPKAGHYFMCTLGYH